MRPIAPHPGKETVRSLLDTQRGAAATTGSASRNVRPSPNAKISASGKQLGGCIDLTDDDEKGSSTKQATNMRTVVQTSQILTPVVPANALRSGILLPGSPVVLQPVTQGVRLGQGNVVYASGTSIVRPGVTVAGPVPQLRPGQILLQQQRSGNNAVTVSRPPPPLKSAPGVQVIFFVWRVVLIKRTPVWNKGRESMRMSSFCGRLLFTHLLEKLKPNVWQWQK